MISGQLSLLAINGNPDEEDLAKAWDFILQQYSDLIKTDKSTSVFDLYKRITYTNWKLTFLSNAISFLKYQYSQPIAERIAEIGYDFIAWSDEREIYLKSIYRVEMEAKFLIVMLNQLSTEYKLLNPNGEAEAIRNAMDYQKELNILSRFMGERIKKEEVTVFEFASYVNSYLEFNKKH